MFVPCSYADATSCSRPGSARVPPTLRPPRMRPDSMPVRSTLPVSMPAHVFALDALRVSEPVSDA